MVHIATCAHRWSSILFPTLVTSLYYPARYFRSFCQEGQHPQLIAVRLTDSEADNVHNGFGANTSLRHQPFSSLQISRVRRSMVVRMHMPGGRYLGSTSRRAFFQKELLRSTSRCTEPALCARCVLIKASVAKRCTISDSLSMTRLLHGTDFAGTEAFIAVKTARAFRHCCV